MKSRSLALFVKSLFLLSRCNDDAQLMTDSTDLQHRVSAIENWCAIANGQISALQSLIQAHENNDYVTGVNPLADGSGYTISFTKSKVIIIKNNEKRDTGDKVEDDKVPIIGIALDSDGNYYWTVKIGDGDPYWMVDNDGKAPVISIAPYTDGNYYWQVNGEWIIANGTLIRAIGCNCDSCATVSKYDSVFEQYGIDNSNDDYVEFTLANNNKITIPKCKPIGIGDDNTNNPIIITSETLTIPITLPNGFSESDYSSIMAQMITINDTASDIKTKSTAEPAWEVMVNKPTFISGVCQDDATIIIKPIMGMLTVGDKSTLEVTIVDVKGNKTTVSRVITAGAIATADATTHTVTLTTKGSLTEELINEALDGGSNLIINGLLSGRCTNDLSAIIDGDWLTLRRAIQNSSSFINLKMNHIIDLIPFAFFQCLKLISVKMAHATSIGNNAFALCDKLSNIELPEATSIDHNAFAYCRKLLTIELPKVTSIGSIAFVHCSELTSAKLPEAISIGDDAFWQCTALTTVELPKAISIGENAFSSCDRLANVILPKATSIGSRAFEACINLTTINLPEATSIESGAFGECYGLTTVELPKVTSIGNRAFKNCYNIATLKFAKIGNVTLGSDVFFAMTHHRTNCKLYLGVDEKPASGNSWKRYDWNSISLYE